MSLSDQKNSIKCSIPDDRYKKKGLYMLKPNALDLFTVLLHKELISFLPPSSHNSSARSSHSARSSNANTQAPALAQAPTPMSGPPASAQAPAPMGATPARTRSTSVGSVGSVGSVVSSNSDSSDSSQSIASSLNSITLVAQKKGLVMKKLDDVKKALEEQKAIMLLQQEEGTKSKPLRIIGTMLQLANDGTLQPGEQYEIGMKASELLKNKNVSMEDVATLARDIMDKRMRGSQMKPVRIASRKKILKRTRKALAKLKGAIAHRRPAIQKLIWYLLITISSN